MAKGEVLTQAQLDIYLGRAKAQVDAAARGNTILPETISNRLANETGTKIGTGLVDPGTNSAGASGVGQMFPQAVADAHKLLYGETLEKGSAKLAEVYKDVTEHPEKSILYSYALYARLEQQTRGLLKSLGITLNDDAAIRTICSAAYHLGFGDRTSKPPIYKGVKDILRRAADPAPFSLSKFVQLYEETAASIGEVNGTVRRDAGIGGTPTAKNGTMTADVQSARSKDVGPQAGDAANYIPLAFDVSGSVPTVPALTIPEGLGNLAWSDKDPTSGGGLVGNPHLRQLDAPAWFELRMNKVNGDSLSDPVGNALKFKLNVSLQSVSTKSQHVVNREPTATGLLITFWGSQPDSIVGRGTTGVFLNTFGLTAYMSSKGSLESNGLYDHLEDVFSQSPRTWAKILQEQEKLRVAAQDAFMEFTALFKNNGVTRFLPLVYQNSRMSQDQQAARDKNAKVWSPTAGASGFQMLNRAGDTYTRGHVAFKYKGQTYLGYFKSLEFTADAKTPFKWDFSFNFRVLRSLSPVFKYQETANG